MASLEKRNQTYRIVFMHGGKRHGFSLKTGDRREAETLAGGVEKTLMRIEQKLLKVPLGVDIVKFVQNDGQVEEAAPAPAAEPITFAQFRDRYLATHESGGMESDSLRTVRIHLGHIAATLGERFPLLSLTSSDLQRHITRRAGVKRAGGRRLSPTTIRKELASFRAAWNWGVHMGLLSGHFPNKGLVYPKTDELPPYQTREEIERQIAAGGLTQEQIDGLWEALYLRPDEIAELLEHVRTNARHPWIYPLACMAGHTGARRSELIRMQVADVDFAGGSVTIREKKRVKGKRSTRRAPLTPLLKDALTAWLADHPGGATLFCQAGQVARSKKRSRTTGHQNGKGRATTLKGRMATVRQRDEAPGREPLTAGECHDHFKQ